jgi:hypothetical protein
MVLPQLTRLKMAPMLVTVLALASLAATGCVEHRTAVNPPLPASQAPAGEPTTVTHLIVGSQVVAGPTVPVTEASPMPIDVPVSVWRRDSDGTLHRGDLRVTTARPWWQRFPADIVTDLAPNDFEVFASGTPTFTPVPTFDRAALYAQAASDGYARRELAPKSTPTSAPTTGAAAGTTSKVTPTP